MAPLPPMGNSETKVDNNPEHWFCPFTQQNCRADCALFTDSEERVKKRCSFLVIAEQLDILAKERKTGF